MVLYFYFALRCSAPVEKLRTAMLGSPALRRAEVGSGTEGRTAKLGSRLHRTTRLGSPERRRPRLRTHAMRTELRRHLARSSQEGSASLRTGLAELRRAGRRRAEQRSPEHRSPELASGAEHRGADYQYRHLLSSAPTAAELWFSRMASAPGCGTPQRGAAGLRTWSST